MLTPFRYFARVLWKCCWYVGDLCTRVTSRTSETWMIWMHACRHNIDTNATKTAELKYIRPRACELCTGRIRVNNPFEFYVWNPLISMQSHNITSRVYKRFSNVYDTRNWTIFSHQTIVNSYFQEWMICDHTNLTIQYLIASLPVAIKFVNCSLFFLNDKMLFQTNYIYNEMQI